MLGMVGARRGIQKDTCKRSQSIKGGGDWRREGEKKVERMRERGAIIFVIVCPFNS